MKHFIHLNDFSKQEIFQIFELADKLKADNGECDWLKGKAIVLFFPESSIRTRVSFENGIKMLGGDTILFPPEALDKKEDIKDVIGYLENWADMVIVTDLMRCHRLAHMTCHQIDELSVIRLCRAAA